MHDPEVRASVMSALLAGQAVGQVAEAYRLPQATVPRWKAEAAAVPRRHETIGQLLVSYLRKNLEALSTQVAVFSDPAWLEAQSAADAAVLHGVLVDKSVRLLEAMDPQAVNENGARGA